MAPYVLRLGAKLPEAIVETFSTSRFLILWIKHPSDRPDPASIRDMLGLNLGEARLASLTADGKTMREAALLLGITEHSARTVFKRVFLKAGISLQAELATRLGRVILKPGS